MAERDTLRAILDDHPELGDFGFGVFRGRSKSPEERAAELARKRDNLLSHGRDGFERARRWLRDQPRTKLPNRRIGTSYGIKHTAEREIGYITNGQFIAAAIAEGYEIKRDGDGPNAYISISSRLRVAPE
jgi:hypothetical protein